jgi:hypothetical protein
MGGFFSNEKLLELLAEAEQLLFKDGYDDESDAVAQAIVMIKNGIDKSTEK